MAKVYTAIEHTDENGSHEVGSDYDLPRNTDAEKAEYTRRVEYGLVSESPVEVPDKDSTSGSSSRRRDRN